MRAPRIRFLGSASGGGGVSVTPSAISAALSTLAPVVVLGAVTIAPSAASLALTTVDPSVSTGALTITPTAITLSFATADPLVDEGGIIVSPSSITASFSTSNPAVVLGATTATPSPATIRLATVDPVILGDGVDVTPSPVVVSFSTVDPSVSQGLSGLIPTRRAKMAFNIDICNQALTRLGEHAISSFYDGENGSTCYRLYLPLRNSLVSMHPWRFAKKYRQLARSIDAPLLEFSYAYALPTDLLDGPLAVFPGIGEGLEPTTDFDIIDNKLLTNHEVVSIEYLYLAPEAKFPPWFSTLVEYALTAAIASEITDQQSLAAEYHKRAFGTASEDFTGGWFAVCISRNDQAHPNEQMDDDGLLEAVRFG